MHMQSKQTTASEFIKELEHAPAWTLTFSFLDDRLELNVWIGDVIHVFYAPSAADFGELRYSLFINAVKTSAKKPEVVAKRRI